MRIWKIINHNHLHLISLLAIILTGCGSAPRIVEVTRTVTQTVVEEGAEIEVTRLIREEREVVASPTPLTPPVFTDPDPKLFISLIAGHIETFDPALAYDAASSDALLNIYEGLIHYDRTDSNSFMPVLAEAVPNNDNGLISVDGLTYTFPIRRGVTFHDGGTLDAHDVAYSIRRQLLQSDPTGPAWLLLEPIMGVGDITENISDGAYVGDPEGLRANASAEELAAVCARVLDAVSYDDESGRVTITLAQPWGPFLASLTWLSVIDQEWAVANGAWDGSCDTWVNHYAPGLENSELNAIANGTGPYRLERWARGEEYQLAAAENYWRTEETPLWDNGPWGKARIPTVIVRTIPEWGARLAAWQAGDADLIEVPYDNENQVDSLVGEWCDYRTGACEPDPANPDGMLRKWDGLPSGNRQDIFLNQSVAADSPYLGSGQLDGDGIPSDFFADENTRRAMATCFNYETFNADVLGGEGVRNNGPIIRDMLGYNPDGAMYTYDPEACAGYLAAAWGGVLPESGFRLQFVYPTAIPGGNQAGAILQSTLAAINEKYMVELVGLPGSVFFPGLFAGQYPLFYSGWIEDIHDPHNWAAPYTVGLYGAVQGLPDELTSQLGELVAGGVAAIDPEQRESFYFELQQVYHDAAPSLILFQRPSFRVEPRWIHGFAYQPGMSIYGPPYYSLSTEP